MSDVKGPETSAREKLKQKGGKWMIPNWPLYKLCDITYYCHHNVTILRSSNALKITNR